MLHMIISGSGCGRNNVYDFTHFVLYLVESWAVFPGLASLSLVQAATNTALCAGRIPGLVALAGDAGMCW